MNDTKHNAFSPDSFPHPRREEMIVRLANEYNVSDTQEYRQLPRGFRDILDTLPYYIILRPLVWKDFRQRGLTYQQLATKYGLTKRQVRYMLTKK